MRKKITRNPPEFRLLFNFSREQAQKSTQAIFYNPVDPGRQFEKTSSRRDVSSSDSSSQSYSKNLPSISLEVLSQEPSNGSHLPRAPINHVKYLCPGQTVRMKFCSFIYFLNLLSNASFKKLLESRNDEVIRSTKLLKAWKRLVNTKHKVGIQRVYEIRLMSR